MEYYYTTGPNFNDYLELKIDKASCSFDMNWWSSPKDISEAVAFILPCIKIETEDLIKEIISYCTIAPCISALEKFKNKIKLTFTSETIKENSMDKICYFLYKNHVIKELSFVGCGIGDDGIDLIVKGIQINTTLEYLDLTQNRISKRGALLFSEYLATNSTMLTLCFGGSWSSGNPIYDEGACSIAKALNGNKTLTTLKLSKCNISSSGVGTLCDTLKNNVTIELIYMPCNQFGDAGASSFALALRKNSSLTSLYIHNCGITARGAQALAESLKVNNSLTHLHLSENSVGLKGVHAFSEALADNTSLTGLALHNNYLRNNNKCVRILKTMKKDLNLKNLSY